MNKYSRIAIAALVGSALSSASAFAQNGPGALNYGAASNPQTGGQAVSAQPASNATGRNAAPQRTRPNSQALGGPAGPGGSYFGAGSGPQNGAQPVSAQPAASNAPSRRAAAPQASGQALAGPAGPGGGNYGAGSNPQTGK
jgi:hypothetical protein